MIGQTLFVRTNYIRFLNKAFLNSKRASFTLQKGTFYTSKGHLLPCKRRPFRTWFATYWCSDGYKDVFRVLSSKIYFMFYKFL